MLGAQVTASGQILLPEAPLPTEQIVQQPGSLLTAAANKVMTATAIQNRAVTLLGGKQSGGAMQVTVHPPQMPTAGTSTVHPNDLYANLYATKAAGLEAAKYDGLHSATPRMIGGRAQRKSRRNHKRHVQSGRRHTRRHRNRGRHVSSAHGRVSRK
jgi:hypothetical protein